MADQVDINGTLVDIDDPCAVARALRKVELTVATGGGVARTRFGEDEVQWHAGNAGRLGALIDRYERLCAAKSGRRSRYAKRLRFIR